MFCTGAANMAVVKLVSAEPVSAVVLAFMPGPPKFCVMPGVTSLVKPAVEHGH